mgnify:FL=1
MIGYIGEGESMGKAVIFDLDGTLLNTLDDLADSVNHTLNYFKYPERRKEEVRSFIGGGAKALIKKSLPENVTAEKYEEVLSYFQAYYKKNADKKTGLYPGVKKLVNKLSDENYSIGVVSAKGDIVVKELVESFLGDKVKETLGEEEGIKRKPTPDSILIMMDTLKCKPEETIYVGDSEVDVEAAANAGIKCASVTWGFRDKEDLEKINPLYIADNVQELYELIKE